MAQLASSRMHRVVIWKQHPSPRNAFTQLREPIAPQRNQS
jgi:hypothetical protein